MDVLLTWVGRRDPWWFDGPKGLVDGPILELLQARAAQGRPFDAVYLLHTVNSQVDRALREAMRDGLERLLRDRPALPLPETKPAVHYLHLARVDLFAARVNRMVRHECKERFPTLRVKRQPVTELVNPTDYQAVYTCMLAARAAIQQAETGRAARDGRERRYFVFLSGGTGQMQTVWVLLALSNQFPATLLATVDPRYRHGGELVREVNLKVSDLPKFHVNPDALALQLEALETKSASLQAERDGLEATARRLEAALAAQGRADAAGPGVSDLPQLTPEYSVREYLRDQELVLYTQAFQQASGSVAATARLLGIEEHACAKRLIAFGLYRRRGGAA